MHVSNKKTHGNDTDNNGSINLSKEINLDLQSSLFGSFITMSFGIGQCFGKYGKESIELAIAMAS